MDKAKLFQRTGDGIGKFGLFARKATDAVFVEAIRFNERLNIDLVAKRGERTHFAADSASEARMGAPTSPTTSKRF